MTRKEQIEKAAQEYINSDAVNPMNMQMAFGDFINGAMWADCNPNQQIVKKMHDDLKTTYDMLNEMFEDYDDARLGVAYRFLGEVLEDLELLIDEEELGVPQEVKTVFEVGDVVKVVQCPTYPEYIGSVGRIVSCKTSRDGQRIYKVESNNKLLRGYALSSHLRKFEEE